MASVPNAIEAGINDPRSVLDRGQVQEQHIDPRRGAQDRSRSIRLAIDQAADLVDRQPAGRGDTSSLKEGGLRADVRVEPRARSRHQVDRSRLIRASP